MNKDSDSDEVGLLFTPQNSKNQSRLTSEDAVEDYEQ